MAGNGMLGHLGVSAQQSFGTATSSYDYMPIISETLTTNIEQLVEEGMRSRFDEGPSHDGLLTVAGDIVVEPHPIMFGHFLKGVTGQASSTAVDSSFTWEFFVKQSDFDKNHALPPYTLALFRDTTKQWQLTDAIFTGLTAEINGGAIVRATINVMAKVSSLETKTTASYETGDPWTWDQTSFSVGGAANDDQENITFTVNNNIEGVTVMNGTKTHGKYKRSGPPTYTLGGTACFGDETEYGEFRAQGNDSTNQRFITTITGDTTAQSYTNEFVVDHPSVRYTTYPVNMGGPGRITVPWEGAAKYNASSGYSVRFTLVNTRASY